MKTKITLLIAFVSLSFTSCIKDFHGGGPEDVVLTETNFIYEGDIFEFYLNSEIKNLEELITKLKSISPNDPEFDQAQKDIFEAEEKQGDFKNQIAGIADLSQVGFGVDPDIPRPPCNCLGLLNSIEYLLTVQGTNIKSVSIMNTDGKVLSKIFTEFTSLSEYKGEILYDRFRVVRKLKGEILINVEKFDEKGDLMDYMVRAYVK